MVSKTKIGIVGTGRMGVLHLSKFSQMPEVELIGIYEPLAHRALEIESKYKIQSFSSLQELCFSSDGLIIASPTPTHFSVAKMAMEMGCHVLIEKPFCETLEEAQQLQALAETQQLVCQVGFLERFRLEAMMAGTPIPQSSHLECHRLSISVGREASVDVVSDLMIHDVDLVLSITRELPLKISAEGFCVVTDHLDIAKARLEFPSG
ncbi:MAG: Gfo/Idh/MocA family protein, partial [Deltaproteobacteria bacterium]